MASGRVISLMTDFGLRDPFVGVVKGVILARFPDARWIDLTHDVPPQDVRWASFWWAESAPYLPPRTVHLAVVDPGVGGERRVLVATRDEQIFVAPDNGLLSGVAVQSKLEVRSCELRFAPPSATFDGRDLFAPLTAALAADALRASEVGPIITDWVRLPEHTIARAQTELTGRVEVVDRFGNLITNLTAGLLPNGVTNVLCAGKAIPLRAKYQDVPHGKLVALVDSWGRVEVAVCGGSAQEVLGVGVGASVRVPLA